MPPSVVPFVGGLKEVPLPSLLHALKDQKKTGILTVSHDKITKSAFFQEGNILFSTSSSPNDSLRIILLRNGTINFMQFKTCEDRLRESGKKEEAILLAQGAIKSKDLFDLLRLQMRGIVLSCFSWTDAQYSFIEKGLPSEVSIGIEIDPYEVIKSGLYGISDITWLMHCLPPSNAILLRSQERVSHDLIGSDQEKEVFGLINNERMVQDILMQSGTEPLVLVQILNLFLATGLVFYRLISASQRFGEQAPVEEKKPLQEGKAWESTEEGVLEESQEEHIKTIHSACKKLSSQNYYEILGVMNNVGTEQIKRAYFKMAKRYHPDRHVGEMFSVVIKEIKEIFLAIQNAYDTLSNSTMRARYDDALLAHPSLTPSQELAQSIHFLLDRAEASVLENDLKNALYCFQEAIRLMPEGIKKSSVYLRYGQLLSGVPGQLHAAEEALQNAANSDTKDFKPYLVLGLVFKKAGLLNKAIVAFQEVLKRNPANSVAMEEMGKLKEKGKK